MTRSLSSSPVLSPCSTDDEAETSSIYTPSDDENEILQQANGRRAAIQNQSSAPNRLSLNNDVVFDESPNPNEPATTDLEEADKEPPQRTTVPCAHITKVKKRGYNFINRVPAAPKKTIRKAKWLALLTSMTVSKLRSTECCSKLKCFRRVSYDQFMESSRFLFSSSTATRRTVLTSYRLSDSTFQFDGNRVCVAFLRKSFRFSSELVAAVRNGTTIRRRSLTHSTGSGSITLTSNNIPTTTRTTESSEQSSISSIQKKKEAVVSFILRIAEDCGDSMPDKVEVHLPFHLYSELYSVFCREFKILYPNQTPVTHDYFRRVWRTNCPRVKVMKSSRFTTCDTCDNIRAALRNQILSGNSTADLKQQRAEHLNFISRERMGYQQKKDRARLQGSEYCSVIVDGSDMSAFGLPHFITTPKSQRGHALKVKLIGLLEHKLENFLFLYTMTQEHETGANHIVEVLHRFINAKRADGPLPRKFFVQLDNCTRENKNRFVMGYFEMLVAHSVFDSVEAGFLPVGHTHEDVDQAFSQTSARLRVHNAITLEDIHGELRQTYKGNVQVEHMRRVANWSGLCDSENCLRKVDRMTQWRYFLFTPSSSGSETMRGHIRPTTCSVKLNFDDAWQLLGNRGARSQAPSVNSFLKHCPNLKNTPSQVISCPEGLDEVTKRLESEEGRVNDIDKLISLHELRDFVFQNRIDAFHWKIEDCVELEFLRQRDGAEDDGKSMPVDVPQVTNTDSASGRSRRLTRRDGENSDQAQDEIQACHNATRSVAGATGQLQTANHAASPPTTAASTSAVQPITKVTYELGSFVIVRTAARPSTSSAPAPKSNVWVGKVLEVITEGRSSYASKIRVHWYDQEKNSSSSGQYIKSKFSPCYTSQESLVKKKGKAPRLTKKTKQRPWCDVIDTDSVKVVFDNLTKTRTVPLQAQNKLSI